MSMHFRNLAEQAMADRAISAEEILALRSAGWDDGRIDAAEAEALFVANDHLDHPSIDWVSFFVEALSEYVVNHSEPRGYVDQAQAEWLIERVDHDGQLDSMAELELLVRILEKAESVPEVLRLYVLHQVEVAVLTGAGQVRDGGELAAGRITDADARLLRRVIFSPGSECPAAVSRGEAELLFRLKDATLDAENADGWPRLFVQGVGNYLMGFSGHEPLNVQRMADLEKFMTGTGAHIGNFLARMASADVDQAASDLLNGLPHIDHDAEVAAAARVTDSEAAWLDARIDADDELDPLEQELLRFIAEETGENPLFG